LLATTFAPHSVLLWAHSLALLHARWVYTNRSGLLRPTCFVISQLCVCPLQASDIHVGMLSLQVANSAAITKPVQYLLALFPFNANSLATLSQQQSYRDMAKSQSRQATRASTSGAQLSANVRHRCQPGDGLLLAPCTRWFAHKGKASMRNVQRIRMLLQFCPQFEFEFLDLRLIHSTSFNASACSNSSAPSIVGVDNIFYERKGFDIDEPCCIQRDSPLRVEPGTIGAMRDHFAPARVVLGHEVTCPEPNRIGEQEPVKVGDDQSALR
jgi:hypothetical protein